MENTVIRFVSRIQNNRDEALAEILRLGECLLDENDFEEHLIEPQNTRAYHASVLHYIDMLPCMSDENIARYKKEIMEERWKLKYSRSDEYLDIGVGKRESFCIGVSPSLIASVVEDTRRIIEDECMEILTDQEASIMKYDKSPILIVSESKRTEIIEDVLREKDMLISDVVAEMSDESWLHKCANITSVASLIEDIRFMRKCGICEAIVECAFGILAAWCDYSRRV
ncbi:hypothetical protein bpr_IV133 (plasmid) [Butyrivibrio proteoclasticus B316]|uniref:Uncharacterized protein n=1 Tax=Butyrivibrio proteoclasticus (strain ATCC 51982 / DSM 14932 / B316) TaxID=515622 RepID=E0S515_BUTPB|nr:hypothetical protein [Butyrivibrio proteoclasticus]ADL36497.1 hypothetical protein bpr_IV133 [Butyrivibrio proteoclasticus B316]